MRIVSKTSRLGGPRIGKYIDGDLFNLLVDRFSIFFEVPWLYSSWMDGRDFWCKVMR